MSTWATGIIAAASSCKPNLTTVNQAYTKQKLRIKIKIKINCESDYGLNDNLGGGGQFYFPTLYEKN